MRLAFVILYSALATASHAQVTSPFSPDATVECGKKTGNWIGCVGRSAEQCVRDSAIVVDVSDGLCKDPASGRFSACPGDLSEPESVFRELCYEYEANFWLGEIRLAIGEIKSPIIAEAGDDVATLLAAGTKAEKAMTNTAPCIFLYRRLGFDPKADWPSDKIQLCRARHFMASLLALDWTLADQEELQ